MGMVNTKIQYKNLSQCPLCNITHESDIALPIAAGHLTLGAESFIPDYR